MGSGDIEQRFDALLRAHGPSLARLAASYARRASEHDDLFQEIALAIWRALPGFRGECSERTFVFRIAHNRGISYLARHRATNTSRDEDSEPPDRQPNPEQALSANQESERLAKAVQSLPLAHRQGGNGGLFAGPIAPDQLEEQAALAAMKPLLEHPGVDTDRDKLARCLTGRSRRQPQASLRASVGLILSARLAGTMDASSAAAIMTAAVNARNPA